MRCEYAESCGFYLYLKGHNKVSEGNCGKESKEVCARYREMHGQKLTDDQRLAFHLKDHQTGMFPVNEAITYEEMKLAREHGLYGV